MTNEPRDRAPPIHDQISAFLDDELSDEETAFLVRRFERDAEAREQLRRYTAIGCALRGELTTADPDALRRRVASALHGAPPQQQTSARVAPVAPSWRPGLVRPLVGFGIAAAVAIAAVVALRSANEARFPAEGVLDRTPVQARQWIEPPSYVVPQDTAESGPVAPPIRLTNYLMRHGEYASGLSRTSVNSNVVGAGEARVPTSDRAVSE
jgi:negative regulator of sigma E activity